MSTQLWLMYRVIVTRRNFTNHIFKTTAKAQNPCHSTARFHVLHSTQTATKMATTTSSAFGSTSTKDTSSIPSDGMTSMARLSIAETTDTSKSLRYIDVRVALVLNCRSCRHPKSIADLHIPLQI